MPGPRLLYGLIYIAKYYTTSAITRLTIEKQI